MRTKLRLSGTIGRFVQGLLARRDGELYLEPAANGTGVGERPRDRDDSATPSRRRKPETAKAYRSCPKCRSTEIRIGRPKRWFDRLKAIVGMPRLSCRNCRHEFSSVVWRWDVLVFARCPRCANLLLGDWHEQYHLPPVYKRALIIFGGRAQRCEPCRHNFVSFRPRWRGAAG